MQSGSNKKKKKKRGRKGQTDRTLLAVYSSDEGRRDKSPPEAQDLCGFSECAFKVEASDRGSVCARVGGENMRRCNFWPCSHLCWALR